MFLTALGDAEHRERPKADAVWLQYTWMRDPTGELALHRGSDSTEDGEKTSNDFMDRMHKLLPTVLASTSSESNSLLLPLLIAMIPSLHALLIFSLSHYYFLNDPEAVWTPMAQAIAYFSGWLLFLYMHSHEGAAKRCLGSGAGFLAFCVILSLLLLTSRVFFMFIPALDCYHPNGDSDSTGWDDSVRADMHNHAACTDPLASLTRGLPPWVSVRALN